MNRVFCQSGQADILRPKVLYNYDDDDDYYITYIYIYIYLNPSQGFSRALG